MAPGASALWLQTVHDKVKKLTGYEMYLFRPPYGAYDNDVIKTAYDMHYYPIQWSVDSLDWKNYGVDSIITTVCNHKAQFLIHYLFPPGKLSSCHNDAHCGFPDHALFLPALSTYHGCFG